MLVGTPDRRRLAIPAVEAQGLSAVEIDDPYLAMAELCRMPAATTGDAKTTVLVLSLQGTYREELQIIPAVRRRLPLVEIWVTDLDGRPAALAEAMRLGIDGLLGEDGLHRLSERPRTARGSQLAADVPTSRVSPLSTPVVPHEQPAVNGRSTRLRPDSGPTDSAIGTEPKRVAEPRNAEVRPAEVHADEPTDDAGGLTPGEPILTAEELRALLHDQPDVPH